MRVWPAIDLLGGEVVQLRGGDPSDRWLSRSDPAAVATSWIEQGFERLHIIDLDAALGRGSQREIVSELRRTFGVQLQVGGGIREDDSVQRLAEEGVDRRWARHAALAAATASWAARVGLAFASAEAWRSPTVSC